MHSVEHYIEMDFQYQLGFQNKRIAIEINESIIPKSKHSSFFLEAKDRIEVIDAVGGG